MFQPDRPDCPLYDEYSRILKNASGPESKEALDFREKNKDDPVFQRRADEADRLYRHTRMRETRAGT